MSKVDCFHTNTFHPHGTPNSYVLDKCRCRPCRDAVNRKARDARSLKALHEYDPTQPATPTDLVDAEPVRQHLQRLSEAGIGWKRVAELAGVATGTVYPIIYGKGAGGGSEQRPIRKRVRRVTAEKILAVKPTLSAYREGTILPPTGTTRRLQALMAQGHSIASIARRLNMLPRNLLPALHGTRNVTLKTAKKVAALYEQLWDQPAVGETWHIKTAVTRTKNYARKHGYAPPQAWDNIDDPEEEPKGVRLREERTWAVEDIEHLVAMGEPPHQIALRYGSKPNSIYDTLRRKNRLDLAQYFGRTSLDERKAA